MFLLVDIEDLLQAYPDRTPAATPERWGKGQHLQLLEANLGEPLERLSSDRAPRHPALVAATLTGLATGGDIPPAGRNIPETGQ
jgi:hypothetical protein